MIQTPTAELEKLAQDAAREIASPEAFEQVEVETVTDLDDRPSLSLPVSDESGISRAASDRATPEERTDVLALMMVRLRD